MQKRIDWVALTIVVALILLSVAFVNQYLASLQRGAPVQYEHFIDYYTPDKEYDILEVEGFLTPEECAHIIAVSRDKLEPSRVYSDKADLNDPKYRKSDQTWLKTDMHPVVDKIDRVVAETTGRPRSNHEDLQVVKYEPSGFFSPHYDACEGDKAFCDRMNVTGGPRLWTFMVYLNDDFTGGETVFPKLGKSVKPKTGKLVVFQDTGDDEEIISNSFHGGEPVTSGQKWICNKWVRHREYT